MDDNYEVLVSAYEPAQQKDIRERLNYYVDWLNSKGIPWYCPDNGRYRDHLLEGGNLKPASVAAHVGTIRSRYRALLKEVQTEIRLQAVAKASDDPQQFLAQVNAAMARATDPDSGRIPYVRAARNSERLTTDQIQRLLQLPDTTTRQELQPEEQKVMTRQELRDIVAIGLLFCTGMNEAELCALQVEDIQQDDHQHGRGVIHVPSVPGGVVERTVGVYDKVLFDQTWLLEFIDVLKRKTAVHTGPLLRGFFRGGNVISSKSLTAKGIQKMLRGYVIRDQRGEQMTITALDLRRAFARRLFRANIPVETIQQQLGHRIEETTWEYIGPPDTRQSRADEGPCSTCDLREKMTDLMRQRNH
jgi:integrase